MFKTKLKELCGIDVRSLAIFRIGLALIIIFDLLIRSQDIGAHYADDGVLPRDILITNTADQWNISLHLMNGTWQFQLFLFIIAAIAAFALLVGYRTRLATVLSWIFLVSLQTRNPIILQGGDMLLRMLLFWGMFLPLGAYWSVDQKSKPLPANPIVSAASIALLLQVCLVYCFTAILKDDPIWRKDGTAIWYALNIEQYVTSFGQFLLQFPNLLKFLTFSTFYIEAFGPFFAFSPIWTGPLRFATALTFILFHIGMGLSMELGPFSYVCVTAWLVFIPEWFWNLFLRKDAFVNGIPWKASWFSNILATLFLVYIIVWNVHTLDKDQSFPFPAIAEITRVDQEWNMFAPYPLRDDGWYVIPGKLQDGTELDLFNGNSPVSWEKPPLLAATYKNDRWRSYLMNLFLLENMDVQLSSYAKYICRSWDETHQKEKQLKSFDIVYMVRHNSVDKPPEEPEKITLWHHSCE